MSTQSIPRRNRLDQMTPTELTIYGATQAVETMPADVRLTNAVIKLGEAQALVADFVDGVPFGEGYPRPPAWQEYEIDTDDVCTLEGFDGVCLMTGDVRASTGLRMTRETARAPADRLHAILAALPNGPAGTFDDQCAAVALKTPGQTGSIPK